MLILLITNPTENEKLSAYFPRTISLPRAPDPWQKWMSGNKAGRTGDDVSESLSQPSDSRWIFALIGILLT